MSNSLNGAHILITRPKHQAEALCQLIELQGGVAVRFPTLEIISLDQGLSATNIDLLLSNIDWLIFTSANAVNFALAAIGGKIRPFAEIRIAAIGKATAKALLEAGLSVDILPEDGFDSEALLAMPQLQNVSGTKILIVRGQGGREELARVLSDRGAIIDFWEVYQRVIPEYNNARVLGLLAMQKLSAIIVTSSESLQNLIFMIGLGYKRELTALPLVVISGRVGELAKKMGFTRIAVADNPSDPAILQATIAIINEDRRG